MKLYRIFCLMIAVLFISLTSEAGMEKYPYFFTDKNNYFSLIPPAGWEGRDEFPEDGRSKVVFSHKDAQTGKKVELAILAYPVDVARSKQSLVNFVENRLNMLKQKSKCEVTPLKDEIIASSGFVQYEVLINNSKILNFVGYPAGKICMTIAFSAPNEVYYDYLTSVKQSLESMLILKGSLKKDDEAIKKQKLAWYQKQASIMFDNNQYKYAMDFLQDALKEYPNDAQLNYQMGFACQKLNDFNAAQISYLKAIENKNGFWEAYFRIGQVFYNNENYQDAEKSFIKALEINPDSIELKNDLAIVYRKTKRSDLAIGLYEEILQINRKNVPVLFNLGRAYSEEGKYDKAYKCFSECMNIEPDNPQVLVNLAVCLARDKKYNEAKTLCERALELDPTIEKARAILSDLKKFTEK